MTGRETNAVTAGRKCLGGVEERRGNNFPKGCSFSSLPLHQYKTVPSASGVARSLILKDFNACAVGRKSKQNCRMAF